MERKSKSNSKKIRKEKEKIMYSEENYNYTHKVYLDINEIDILFELTYKYFGIELYEYKTNKDRVKFLLWNMKDDLEYEENNLISIYFNKYYKNLYGWVPGKGEAIHYQKLFRRKKLKNILK